MPNVPERTPATIPKMTALVYVEESFDSLEPSLLKEII